MLARIWMGALAALLVVGGGCKKEKAPESAGKPAPEPLPVSKPGYPSPGDLPIVDLLQGGSGDRTKLRYTVSKGVTERMVMTMTMTMEMDMGIQKVPRTRTPPMVIAGNIQVDDVSAEGDMSQRFRFDDITVEDDGSFDPSLVANLRQSMGDIKGLNGSAVVTNRGLTRSAEIDLSGVTNPQVKQMMASMQNSMKELSAPLPEEPVGVGAKWEVRQSVELNGMRVFQTATFELKELSDTTARLAVTVDQSAPPQKFTPPGVPIGVTAELKSLRSQGSGTMELVFGKLVPKSAMTLTSKTAMTVNAMGQKQDVSTDMSIELAISSSR